jgi:hypothetical protein
MAPRRQQACEAAHALVGNTVLLEADRGFQQVIATRTKMTVRALGLC